MFSCNRLKVAAPYHRHQLCITLVSRVLRHTYGDAIYLCDTLNQCKAFFKINVNASLFIPISAR